MGITFSSSSSIVAAKSQYINRIMAIVIPTIVQGLVFFFFMLANIINVLLSMNVNQCILFVYLRIFLVKVLDYFGQKHSINKISHFVSG